MRKRWTNVLLGIALSSGTVIACTGGPGPFPTLDDPYDRPPDSRDKPGDTRQNPGDTRQAPPAPNENPGSQGGGPTTSSGGSSHCPPCDGTFKCVSMSGGKSGTDTVVLATQNGKCVILDKGKASGSIECDGTIISDGKPAGTWTSTGADNFTATASGTVNGQPVTVTTMCTRGAAQTPTGTTTVTPGPTTTGSPPPITDAGIKG